MAKLMHIVQFSSCNIMLVFVIATLTVKAQNSCNTPRGENGMCVPYKKCTLVTALFERYRNAIPDSLSQEIRTRHCPQFKNEIYICCELHYVDNATETKLQSQFLANQNANSTDGINQVGLNILRSMSCGVSSTIPDRIVIGYGEIADLGEFPWMALLQYDSDEQFQCGGSLITERYVLTAAHCVTDARNRVIGVRLGEHDISTEIDCQTKFGSEESCALPVQNFGIEKIIPHESYQGIKNDVALIRLDRNVECQTNIRPVCLPLSSQNKEVHVNRQYFIAGWGLTETQERSNILLKALIPHQPIETCRNVFRSNAADISDMHLCAGGINRKDTCKGDSGGPLFSTVIDNNTPRTVQLGVVSFGVPVCSPEKSYPTLFTKVEAFLPWITNKLAEYERIESLTCSNKQRARALN